MLKYRILLALVIISYQESAFGTEYYLHPDSGKSNQQPFRTLK